jgi:chromosome segregation ATPase
MADPFTIVAGILSLVDVSARLSSKTRYIARTIKHAPAEILALGNELEDLRVVLHEVESCQEELSLMLKDRPAVHTSLVDEITKARDQVLQLEDVIDHVSSGEGNMRLRWLRKQRHIHDVQAELRKTRQRVQELLMSFNVYAGLHATGRMSQEINNWS